MRADLLEREAFLRAIFADPDNDMPRLVFADYLDERGESDWAELIRLQCELYPIRKKSEKSNDMCFSGNDRELELFKRLNVNPLTFGPRGIPAEMENLVQLETAWLENEGELLRQYTVERYPAWYGAKKLQIFEGQFVTKEQLTTLFNSPVTTNVVEFDLSGRELQIPQDIAGIRMFDIEIKPVISRSMVEVLAKMKEIRRVRVLDLRNNDLGNDAIWALARSPYLIRLERLYLSEGNRFRGRVWQQIRERFGQDIVE